MTPSVPRSLKAMLNVTVYMFKYQYQCYSMNLALDEVTKAYKLCKSMALWEHSKRSNIKLSKLYWNIRKVS